MAGKRSSGGSLLNKSPARRGYKITIIPRQPVKLVVRLAPFFFFLLSFHSYNTPAVRAKKKLIGPGEVQRRIGGEFKVECSNLSNYLVAMELLGPDESEPASSRNISRA
jgi:hypothetical protein